LGKPVGPQSTFLLRLITSIGIPVAAGGKSGDKIRFAIYRSLPDGSKPGRLQRDAGEVLIPQSAGMASVPFNPSWHVLNNGGWYWLGIELKQPSNAEFFVGIPAAATAGGQGPDYLLIGGNVPSFVPDFAFQQNISMPNIVLQSLSYCATMPYGPFPETAPMNGNFANLKLGYYWYTFLVGLTH
jgi:hypothetical protein